jgi:hypothetical protein
MEPIDDLDSLRDALKPLAERKLIVFLGEEGRRGTLITHGFHNAKEIELLKSHVPLQETVSAAPALSGTWASAEDLAKIQDEVAALKTQVHSLHDALTYTKQQLQTLKDSLGG